MSGSRNYRDLDAWKVAMELAKLFTERRVVFRNKSGTA
jgi:hypothetical protein